ncbi:N-acetylneuraminate synthase family protein, partial [Candidatus Pelagibacter sp.]|nr:N-acetylneuraminate synthase family protein [Candidatus Pelagibacter sp.]
MFINKDTKKTFIIAEVGNNHEGNISVAKKLINLASKAGVDAIKFQTFITEKFINKDNKKRFNQLKRFELSFKQFKILKDLANKKKLKFVSTPLDLKSANFLIKNSDIIKVASSDNNFFPLLDIILKSKKKVIISTGMTSIKNILNLISYISKKIGTKKMIERISLLHCV